MTESLFNERFFLYLGGENGPRDFDVGQGEVPSSPQNSCYHLMDANRSSMLHPPKRFDIFPPDWGMLIRSRRVQIFI